MEADRTDKPVMMVKEEAVSEAHWFGPQLDRPFQERIDRIWFNCVHAMRIIRIRTNRQRSGKMFVSDGVQPGNPMLAFNAKIWPCTSPPRVTIGTSLSSLRLSPRQRYFSCRRAADCSEPTNSMYTMDNRTKLDSLLNGAPASFDGALLQVNPGTYHMMCTRNNNFSNRAQKGTLIVK